MTICFRQLQSTGMSLKKTNKKKFLGFRDGARAGIRVEVTIVGGIVVDVGVVVRAGCNKYDWAHVV